MSGGYEGPVRLLGSDGILLTTGTARIEPDSEMGSWKGVVQTLPGTAVAGKALVVEIETPEGRRGRAQLIPQTANGERATSSITGFGPSPF